MEFKKLITILTISIAVIVVALLGFSYAWYSFTGGSTEFETTTGSSENLQVVFAQSQYVNTVTGIPLAASDVDKKSDKTLFSVTADSTTLSGFDVASEISLVDISIDEALKTSDFHYALYETANGTTTLITSGTGVNIGNNASLVLKSMSLITKDVTYNYELRIWLQDSGVSQNELMQKSFSAKIQVTSSMKK